MFKKINLPPKSIDSFFLCLLAGLLMYNPFYLHGAINIYELELYLPAINGVLKGFLPYRDFFYLRGPLEFYLPAALMSIFGNKLSVLSTFFYVGNVLTVFLSVLIAKEIFKTRYVLFLLTLILTARTFPRVVFTYWGGMRYCLGLMAVYFAITYFKTKRKSWIILASATCVFAFLTSVDVGICALGSISLSVLALIFRKKEGSLNFSETFRSAMIGFFLVAIPFLLLATFTAFLDEYMDATYQVVTRMTTIINHHSIVEYPATFGEALAAMVNPASKNFRHMTPCYLYLIFGGYLLFSARKKENAQWMPLFCLFIYGILLYFVSFRSLWGSNFEMALQPEKILYFFLIERFYTYLIAKKQSLTIQDKADKKKALKIFGIMFLFVGLFMSTVCYSLMRFDSRFYSYQFFKYKLLGKDVSEIEPLAGDPKRAVNLEKLEGYVVPRAQAEEFEAVFNYFQAKTSPSDPVFFFPERGGFYSYLINRPSIGRFPTFTMSWLHDDWYQEALGAFIEIQPKYVVLPVDLQEQKYAVYFAYGPNREKYDETLSIINAKYKLVASTLASRIYEKQ